MPGEAPAPMYCAHVGTYGCELSNCEEHECHLDDREDTEIRMPDPNTEHGLRVQLATALQERDAAKDRAHQLNSVALERGRQIAFERERFSEARKELTALKSERGALRAEVKRLRDLCRDVQGWMDEKHATAHFDGLAEKFLKATGHLPPGKSRPMEMGVESEQEQEDNRARWRAFNQKALADVCERIRAALCTGGDRG